MKKVSIALLFLISIPVFAFCSLTDESCQNQRELIQLQKRQSRMQEELLHQMKREQAQREMNVVVNRANSRY